MVGFWKYFEVQEYSLVGNIPRREREASGVVPGFLL